MKYRQKVEGVVVTRNGNILLVKAPSSQFWMLPGGGIESDEKKEDAAKRELREECGVEICKIKFLHEFERINDYSLLTKKYRKSFSKNKYLGAAVHTFQAHVLEENMLHMEEGAEFLQTTPEEAIKIFSYQSEVQEEVLFQWIEKCRIQHIKAVCK